MESKKKKQEKKKQAPPELIEKDYPFEVEDILGEKTENRRKLYLVKWKGYDHSHNTWEPKTSFAFPEKVLGLCKRSKQKKKIGEAADENGNVYKVESIVYHRNEKKRVMYYVKWLGYEHLENSWEPESAFPPEHKVLADYKLRHQIK